MGILLSKHQALESSGLEKHQYFVDTSYSVSHSLAYLWRYLWHIPRDDAFSFAWRNRRFELSGHILQTVNKSRFWAFLGVP